VIDNLVRVDRLITILRQALPLSASVTPRAAALIRDELSGWSSARQYPIVQIDYAGDEGGIMCKLEVGEAIGERALYMSITHLSFDRRAPLAREIAAYQKHRNKRLKRVRSMDLIEVIHADRG
jgi:hypothetical protein